MKISSLLKISALVWVSSLFWFFLDFFYVIFVRKQSFNQVSVIFTILLLGIMLIGSIAFLIMVGSLLTIFLKRINSVKIRLIILTFILLFLLVVPIIIILNARQQKQELNIFSTDFIKNPVFSSQFEASEIIKRTNMEREKIGLKKLTEDSKLDLAAKEKTNDMIKKNYWEHNSPSGDTPWTFIKNAGYKYLYAGENLGRGSPNASDQMNAWMASPEHKNNILSPNFTDIGVYFIKVNFQGENTYLAVQEFGSPGGENSISIPQLSILQVQSYRQNIVNITPSWESVRNKYPQDVMNKLLDSLTRQVVFCDQIITDYNKNGRFITSDNSLWDAVNKMGDETSQITNNLNSNSN